jgi:integrase
VRLALLTGCRRDEIGGLRWDEIKDGLITIPQTRTKTGIVHEVPLSALAAAQLPSETRGRNAVFGRGEGGFQGWSRSKRQLDRRVATLRNLEAGRREHREELAKMPAWGLHDLRRTLSTRLNEAGIEPHVVEALLGHAGAKRGVAGVYNRALYRKQKAEALDRWADIVAATIRLSA